jgi:hypothetical protein
LIFQEFFDRDQVCVVLQMKDGQKDMFFMPG